MSPTKTVRQNVESLTLPSHWTVHYDEDDDGNDRACIGPEGDAGEAVGGCIAWAPFGIAFFPHGGGEADYDVPEGVSAEIAVDAASRLEGAA